MLTQGFTLFRSHSAEKCLPTSTVLCQKSLRRNRDLISSSSLICHSQYAQLPSWEYCHLSLPDQFRLWFVQFPPDARPSLFLSKLCLQASLYDDHLLWRTYRSSQGPGTIFKNKVSFQHIPHIVARIGTESKLHQLYRCCERAQPSQQQTDCNNSIGTRREFRRNNLFENVMRIDIQASADFKKVSIFFNILLFWIRQKDHSQIQRSWSYVPLRNNWCIHGDTNGLEANYFDA